MNLCGRGDKDIFTVADALWLGMEPSDERRPNRIDRRFAALRRRGPRRRWSPSSPPAIPTRHLARSCKALPGGRCRRHRARHAVFRSDGRWPGDPGWPACARSRPARRWRKTLAWCATSAKRRHRDADRADGLLQPDLSHGRGCVPGRRCAEIGVDGLIIVDLPPEEDEELCQPAIDAGLNWIRLATPTTDDKRLPAVLNNTSGFVYYVSITGITGSAAPDAAKVGAAVSRIKRHTKLPVAVGFGIKNAGTGGRHRARGRRRRGRLGAGRCRSPSLDAAGRTGRPTGRWRRAPGGARATGVVASDLARRRTAAPKRRMRDLTHELDHQLRPARRSATARSASKDVPENLWIKCPSCGRWSSTAISRRTSGSASIPATTCAWPPRAAGDAVRRRQATT